MNIQFWKVMRFEFMTYMRNKVYVGMTLAFVIILAITLSIPGIVELVKSTGITLPGQNEGPKPEDAIFVMDRTGLTADLAFLKQALPDELWQTAETGRLAELKSDIADQKARAILVIETPDTYTWIVHRASMTDTLPMQVQAILGQYFTSVKLAQYGLDETAIGEVMKQPVLTTQETVESSGKTMEQTYAYTYLLLFLLYMTVMMYGQLVATSIASEKSNRAMEMLITSARPLNLMFGKVIGSGLAGLAQIAALLITAGVFYQINAAFLTEIPFVRSIFEMPLAILVYTLVFYLTGYFAYAFLYGALGSLASRTEDINTSIMPIMLLFMAAFFVSFTGMFTPEAGWFTICSFVPFLAAMVMFVRICMTDVPGWQILVSIVIQLAAIWATGWISSKIYRLGVLMYGKPPKLKELTRMLRNAR